MPETSKTPAPLAHVLVLLLFLLAVGTYFHPVFLRGFALVPIGLLYRYSPWSGLNIMPRGTSQNWDLFDQVFEFYPWRHFLIDRQEAGFIPLWNDLNFFGHPFLAIYQAKVFYPIHAVLPLFNEKHIPAFLGILHIGIAFLGMYLLMHVYRCGRGASTISATSYAFGGFMILWLGHPHSKVAAWMPWVFLCAERLIRKPNLPRFCWLTVVVFLQYSAGHVQTSMQVLVGLILYLTARYLYHYRNWTPAHTKSIGGILAALTLGTILHGATLVPFTEYLFLSSAYEARKDGVPMQPYLAPDLIVSQLLPKLYGAPFDGQARGTSFRLDATINETAAGYVGILPLFLAILGFTDRRYRRYKLPHAFLVVFSFGIAYGWPVIFPVSQQIPIFRMSYTFRYLLVSGFSLAILGGLGFEGMVRKRDGVNPLFRIGLLLGTSAVFGGTAYLLMPSLGAGLLGDPRAEVIRVFVNLHLVTFGMLILISQILLFMGILTRPRSQPLALLVAAVIFTDLYLVGFRANPAYPSRFVFPDGVRGIEFLSQAPQPPRFLGLDRALPPHVNMLYDLDDARGNDALSPLYQERFLGFIDPGIFDPRVLPALRQLTVTQFRSNYLDAAGIEYVLVPNSFRIRGTGALEYVYSGEVQILRNSRSFGPAVVAYDWTEHESLDAISNDWERRPPDLTQTVSVVRGAVPATPTTPDRPMTKARVLSRDHHRVVYQAKADSDAVFMALQTQFPGWKATVNGAPAETFHANIAFTGIALGPGEHEIVLQYEPDSYRVGLFLTLFATLMLSGCGVVALRRWQEGAYREPTKPVSDESADELAIEL